MFIFSNNHLIVVVVVVIVVVIVVVVGTVLEVMVVLKEAASVIVVVVVAAARQNKCVNEKEDFKMTYILLNLLHNRQKVQYCSTDRCTNYKFFLQCSLNKILL